MESTTISKLKEWVEAYGADCADAKSNMRNFTFGEGNSLSFVPDLANPQVRMQATFNDWSFNQLCFKMDVPAGWVGNPKHCPDDLKNAILNDLANKYRDDADMLIRMKGTVIRAMLSAQYSQFDNAEFIDLVGEAVSTMGISAQVHRASVGDDLRSYLVFPSITFAPDPKQQPGHDDGGLHPALYLSNSERGGGMARVVGGVYRSICTNGMIYGWKDQTTFEVRHRFHSRAMMGALMADGIAEGLRMSEEATKRFIASQDIKVAQVNLAPIVDGWAAKYGITVETKESWLASITSEATANGRRDDVRLFDVINAATYVAQEQEGQQTELIERMAGDILRGG